MKNKSLITLIAAITLFWVFPFGAKSQAPTYICEVRNDVLLSPTEYKFEVWLVRTGTTAFEFAGMQMGFRFNNEIIPTGATLTLVPTMVYTVNACNANNAVNCSIVSTGTPATKGMKITLGVPTCGAGNGTIISNTAPGHLVGTFKLVSSLPFVSNTKANMSWWFTSPQPWPTKVFYYTTSSLDCTVQASHITTNMNNPFLNPVTCIPYPMGANSSYCQGAAGANVELTNSQLGFNYTLIKNGVATTTILAGTGAALSFGAQTAGVYKAIANPGSVMMIDSTIITETPSTTPTFTQLGPYCVGDAPGTLPLTSINGIPGTWNPSAISTATAGSTTYTFTPSGGVCPTTTTMTIVVNAPVLPTFTQLGPYCVGATPGTLPLTSSNGITGNWNPATVSTSTAGSTTYTFTPTAGQCAASASMTIVVNAPATPTFTQLGPYCVGATPGTLALTSTNSITGTWNPATITTAAAGSTTYTFTPAAGQCGTTTTMTIVVNAPVTPTFTQLGPYCVGATPGTLPLTSTNSITGTWSPATISTATAGSITYTFTPNAGQCGTTTTMTVVVNAPLVPTFTQLGPYCIGATPGILPLTSTNSITGTWNPATISTAAAGSITYTFTPTAGQCATTKTMTIVVNALTVPTFTQLGPYCVGSTPGTLPLTSNNSISGIWNPATISTSAAGSTTYTFTPTAGQCAATATMTIVINAPIVPTFTQLGPYCVGATPGTLPLTSTNSITGTWNPATISTAAAGSTTYTFTPTAGQCATTKTMTIVVNAPTVPTFTQLGPYCVGATAGTLPLTSSNGITGTWNPSTISTATAGSTTYTFTPAAGQCGTTATMTIVVNAATVPTFTQLGPYCVGATAGTLPLTSNNGIAGTWNPATISTATAGSTTYTFTPNAGQCAATATMTIVITAPTVPTFTQLGLYCVNSTPGTLPLTSNNGITGTWNPAVISTAVAGSFTYTFTPMAGLCATTATMVIVIDPCIGIETLTDDISKLVVYPNPTEDRLYISFDKISENPKSLRIFNAMGQLCYETEQPLLVNQNGIEVGHMATGTYTLQVVFEKGMVNKTFIVK